MPRLAPGWTTDEEGRAVVSEILEQSDAFRRGCATTTKSSALPPAGVSTANGLKNILGILPKGWAALSYSRDGSDTIFSCFAGIA